MENQDIKEENRRIRFLRFLVDLSLRSIQENDHSLEEALELVEEAKRAALNLFPGKELAFELIYRPRFQRAIEARFGTPLTPPSPLRGEGKVVATRNRGEGPSPFVSSPES